MSKIVAVQQYVDGIFMQLPNEQIKQEAYVHTYGVSQCCALLADNLGLNTELASVIGLLHDAYVYRTGYRALHGINGAEMIRVAFKYQLQGVFTGDEQTIIKSAIYHHSDKAHIHDAYDELLKDSDILQRYLCDVSSDIWACDRLTRLGRELGISVPQQDTLYDDEKVSSFTREKLGDVAQKLASKKIHGLLDDAKFAEIIHYFPEESAYDELVNAWCAAFVFHCCVKSGLKLPLRMVHNAKSISNNRLACVSAWHEWGLANGFCLYEKDGIVPAKGDIVIYDNIIPAERKQPDDKGFDHIGIVLSSDSKKITVAEGNCDNLNVSDICVRKRDHTIGCYIRIPDYYIYEGWMIDYKTGEQRVVPFT